MKNTGLKIFAYFAVALMLVSILSAGALAASDNGMNDNGVASDSDDENENVTTEDSDDDDAPGIQQHDRDRDMVHADEDAPRVRNANAVRDKVQKAKDARANYMDAKDNFAKIKANNKNLDSEEALQAAKEYLETTIDHMISLIENNENIDDNYIEDLEAEREELTEADTRQELAESAKDINKIWKDARKEQVISSTENINNRMKSMFKTSNSVAVRLEKEIQRMENNGQDVTELEEMLEEYNELIAEAEGNYEQARNNFRKGDAEYGESLRYMNEAGQNINQANLMLKNMLKEMKQYREGVVSLDGNGILEADGNGSAVLSGNLSLNFSATDGKLVIKDMAGDAVINTDDASYESSNIDSGNSTYNNRAFVYHNITGDVTIEGSRLTVMLRGEEISLTAKGTGTAVLAGDGSYTVTKDGETTDGEWTERQYEDEEDEDTENEVESTEIEAEAEDDEDSADDSGEDESENDDEDESEDDNESESGNNS